MAWIFGFNALQDYLWKQPNACVVPPLPRRVRQESADTATETFRAGTYAKITERGSGQYQRFVRSAFIIKLQNFHISK
jgi:hypothetical protein